MRVAKPELDAADMSGKLLGVLDIKELLIAEPLIQLKDFMVENVINLRCDCTMKAASSAFLRYGFRALPVVDENEVLQAVVPYREIIYLKHRMLE